MEDRLRIAVFIDFDNIEIGVKNTLGRDFEVSPVLEALKERGDVLTKIAYADWTRQGTLSRSMTQHAVQMVQRHPGPRGDKNGADINLALDALEMALTKPHIDAFAIASVVCAQRHPEQPREEARARLVERLRARGLLK